ncbi:hypothetical protein KI387_017374, partial [Taxus chinensis]
RSVLWITCQGHPCPGISCLTRSQFDSTGFKNRTPVVGIYVPAAHTCNQALHVHINLWFGSRVNRHRNHKKTSAYFGSMKLIQ